MLESVLLPAETKDMFIVVVWFGHLRPLEIQGSVDPSESPQQLSCPPLYKLLSAPTAVNLSSPL